MANHGIPPIVQRTLTGAIFVGVIIASLLFDAYASFVVFGIAMYITLMEFLHMTAGETISKAHVTMLKVLMMGIYALSYFYATGQVVVSPLYAIVPFFIILGIMELYNKDGDTFKNISAAVTGLVYVVLPFSLINIMIHLSGEFNGQMLLIIFILIWANDSFAYLFGVSIGKRKLWERISPKKSWEGFIGGGISTLILSGVLAHFLYPNHTIEMIGLAIIVVVFGTFGDLFESKLKRQFKVKDSGTMLPGHGGFLDRFDSFLFIIPMTILYLQVVAI